MITRSATLIALAATLTVPHGASGQTLGSVSFPTSGSPTAQPRFLRGVLYLHSFEYDAAGKAFREAQRLDPGFTMAYWGEALTYTHPVWNQQDLAAGRAALANLARTAGARRARTPTARERGYLNAVELLYGEGSKPRRDTLYSLAMERLAAANPDDLEAQSFYALALLGLSQGVRVVPTYMQAGAIAEEVFRQNPDHPGAAHYVIHAFDDPAHAPLGLRAARAYSRIAPDAPHAQHMTTHIFLALGMWDDVISQNQVASGHDHDAWNPGHYTAWLLYGLAQAGRHDEARRLLETTSRNLARGAAPSPAPSRVAYLHSMRAHYLIDTERWEDPVREWQLPPMPWPVPKAMDAFTQGYAALQRGDRAGAEQWLEQLSARGSGPAVDDDYGGSASVPGVLERELKAAIAHSAGRTDEAIRLLQEVAKIEEGLPVEFGPPDILKPSHELLGEVLLAAGRPAEAQREFQRALELAPKRALSLVGLVRAAKAAGDDAVARRACETLRGVWRSADQGLRGRPELTCS